MPKSKSTKRRTRKSEEARLLNKATKTNIVTVRKKLYAAIESGDRAGSGKLYNAYCSALDKAVKKGAIKANNASRRKSRATLHMNRELSATA